MNVLKEGNDETTKEKNPIKFIWGHKFEYDNTESIPLAQEILNVFDQIMYAIFARIMQKDKGEQFSMKTKGTKIPMLEKSHSIVNVTQSETLVRDGFDIIFNQL